MGSFFNILKETLTNKSFLIKFIPVLIIMIALPGGVYLAQNTQIFRPRASSTPPNQISIPEACTPGNYSFLASCDGALGLNFSWDIPHSEDRNADTSCNVFIHDETDNKTHTISQSCKGATLRNFLPNPDNPNQVVPVRGGHKYTFYVSNGIENSCYNKSVGSAEVNCGGSLPISGSSTRFQKVKEGGLDGWSQEDLRRYRSLGFYPVQEENGDIDLLTRREYVEYMCNKDDSCVPKESPTLYTTKNSDVFLKNLLAKLYDRGFAPIPALRPYFLSDIDDLVLLNSNSDVLKAFQSGEYNLIGVPRLNTSQDQFRTVITETELLNIIKEVATSDEYRNDRLYKSAEELRASNEEWPVLNALLDLYDPIFGVRSAVTFFAIAPDQQSPGTRIKHSLGVVTVLFPGVGKGGEVVAKPLAMSALQKAKVASQAFKSSELVNKITPIFTKKVGNLDVVPVTKIESTVTVLDRLGNPIVLDRLGNFIVNGRVQHIISGVFPRQTVARMTGWTRADSILGASTKAFDYVEEVAAVVPVPVKPNELWHFFGDEYTLGIRDALLAGKAYVINKTSVVIPVSENVIDVYDWVAVKLRKPRLDNRVKDAMRAKADKNLTFVVDDAFANGAGGFANDDLIVMSESMYVSDEGLHGLQHEFTHRLHNVIAEILGRARFIGFDYIQPQKFYDKVQNGTPLNRNEIFSIFYEMGTDLSGIVARRIRENKQIDLGEVLVEGLDKGYTQNMQNFYSAIMKKYNNNEEEVVYFLIELAQTGDARGFIQRMGGIPSFQRFVASTDTHVLQQGDAFVLQQYFKSQGINIEKLIPAAAAGSTGVAVTGTLYVNNELRKTGPQLNYDHAAASGVVPNSVVTNIYLELPNGGSPDIIGNTQNAFGPFPLRSPLICDSQGYEDVGIRVKLTNSNEERRLKIRFKLAADKKSTICGTSGGINPITAVYKKPENLNGSCSQSPYDPNSTSTLNLSWNKVDGAVKYKMRGRKVEPTQTNYYPTTDGTPNGPPNTKWADDVQGTDKYLSNNDGEFITCDEGTGGKCALSFSGLAPNYTYRLWVNAWFDDVNHSENTYLSGLVTCQALDNKKGDRITKPPSNVKVSCVDHKIKVEWDRNDPNSLSHIRGLQTDDEQYFPPDNWTDGVSTAKRITLNSENEHCNGNHCSVTDSITRTGKWRVWIDEFLDQDNKTTNTYVNGTVDCDAGTTATSPQYAAPSTPTPRAAMIFVGGRQLLTTGQNTINHDLSPDSSNQATLEVMVNGVTKVIRFVVNRQQAPAGLTLSLSSNVNGKTVYRTSGNEIKAVCDSTAADSKGRVPVVIEVANEDNKTFHLDESAESYNECQNRINPCQAESCSTEGDFCWNGTSGRRYLLKNDVTYQLWYRTSNASIDSPKITFKCGGDAVRTSSALTADSSSSNVSVVSSSCSGTQATVSWSGNFEKYDLRFDNQKDPWNGTCNSAEGDTCINGHAGGNSYTFEAKPGRYDWWLQGFNGGTGSNVPHGFFECTQDSSGSATNTLQTTCNGNGTATISWPAASGATKYALRADGPMSYSGNTCGPHNLCVDNYTNTSVTVNTTPGSYRFWMHSADSSNNLSAVLYDKTFSCP